MIKLTREAVLETASLEEVARNNPLRISKSIDDALRIKAIWDLSAVGTVLKEFQDDRWKSITWMGWTDRRRLIYSAFLMRHITERITGKTHKVPVGEKLAVDQIASLKMDIGMFSPYLIYGSTKEQNDDVREALKQPGVIIPENKVHIIDFPEKPVGVNTIDQMKNFSLPTSPEAKREDTLILVAHAPHLVRALHIMNRFHPLPKGLAVQPYPLPSPSSAGVNYAMLEISGLLYYTFITKESAEKPYPYKI